MNACGVDFGTSNSGVSIPDGESVRLVEIEGEATSIPSAVFFALEESQPVLYGRAAVDEYLDGTPGWLMRSLKSVLGSSLMQETTAIGSRSIVYADILTLYLRTLRDRACANAGADLGAVVLGRPSRSDEDVSDCDGEPQRTPKAAPPPAVFRAVGSQFEPIA